ncbi:cytochrome B6 [filamentous cyanobacterium CCP5]|nr:cytochrome B6 [filamentous cyanobacterium CCP5]
MNRRELLDWIGVGALASSLPVAIATGSGDEGAPNGTSIQPVRKLSDLSEAGQILDENFAAGPVLVVADPQNPARATAVNPTCPHAGCTATWQAEQGLVECPCHSSKFAADGSVEQGPASSSLATYAVRVEGDSILVETR